MIKKSNNKETFDGVPAKAKFLLSKLVLAKQASDVRLGRGVKWTNDE